MPSTVRSAINRNAQRIATTTAYRVLKEELEARAAELILYYRDNPNAVVQRLDEMDIDYGPRASLQSA